MKEEELTQRTAVFKALADPNRLRIFAELMAGDTCNCELKDKLGLAPNLLSHHLKVLESVGLVSSRRDVVDGRWVYYAANREAVAQWQSWLATFFDPARIQCRTLCGPEGQLITAVEVR
ncbi:MAG: winged helix-turn-helix transcriptional regulator [Anaerolineaceae bacterium]|nr:winged helix-turn-helix transcriptional regulator [Anaerolineaceae bacterium]